MCDQTEEVGRSRLQLQHACREGPSQSRCILNGSHRVPSKDLHCMTLVLVRGLHTFICEGDSGSGNVARKASRSPNPAAGPETAFPPAQAPTIQKSTLPSSESFLCSIP
jgi:hypothetical protein